MFRGHLNYFQKPHLGGRPNTKLGDHDIPNVHNRWFILFYHVWGPAWIDIHWISIWSRTQSQMTSHYTWGPVTTLHDFEGGLGRPWTLSFGLSKSSWSQLLARVLSGPKPWNKTLDKQPNHSHQFERDKTTWPSLRATSHISKGPWPFNWEGSRVSSKDCINCLVDMLCHVGTQAKFPSW